MDAEGVYECGERGKEKENKKIKTNQKNPIHFHSSANPEVKNEGEEDGLEAARRNRIVLCYLENYCLSVIWK